ncbi:potassium-transporting ATPase subunit KdpB [Ramlibacter sp. G-1-2-2]|uniref:Potassium-transporting ATPase ATP-binding subunit n=1 Tax=Ramlibacter agri TaxID=2728837 RepID=A0A848H3U2_9BURK|nr:potassium-transporting ATPase subunit KdpB [Ramlibacter agri]NML44221.1 potassium-transporting ATPase subunit KdpB [Ramlibacter agri]
MSKHPRPQLRLFDPALVKPALAGAFAKLNPRVQVHNPVMFVVYIGSIVCTLLWVDALRGGGETNAGFIFAIALWLWFTVLFANFAEALAEGRSKAQAASLRGMKKSVWAKRYDAAGADGRWHGAAWLPRRGEELAKDDVVLVEPEDIVPLDGEVIEGVAAVDESAITGESAPVVREAGGDFSSVTGGTRVLSDWLVVRITVNPGESFLDRMIGMVESARRQKTPNEIALHILLIALTIVFLVVTATLLPYSIFSVEASGAGQVVTITALVSLLVCLIPTTIGGLLSAIGVAGMSRMMGANVIATSGRAVEAAGDVDVMLLDKTGTITHGNRQASAFYPAPGVTQEQLARTALLASLADETPEGRSIVDLARRLRVDDRPIDGARLIPFSAEHRMSGVDIPLPELEATGGAAVVAERVQALRKGAADAVRAYVQMLGGAVPADVLRTSDEVARRGSTPLVVAEGDTVRGVIELKDIVKTGIRERFTELRRMGIRTVMITGDNKLTAAAIAAEAGVDDFVAQVAPEGKLKLIREYQAEGRLVAMTGDGTNDAPALAQADVAVVMNSGTQAAKEAGNMVDLDSDPTKLLEVVETGKALLMTRGSLTTFSIANDVAKYFAILPAIFVTTYPQLQALNVMRLASPQSAILSAVIFNALVIVFLIPLALQGVRYRPVGAAALLRRNLAIYGLGGLVVPFVGIKLIDMILAAFGLA